MSLAVPEEFVVGSRLAIALAKEMEKGAEFMTEQAEKYEWKDLSPEIAIRQGDLLVTRNPESQAVDKMVVVITADCDIDKRKHGPQIACLNVQFHDEYVRTTWSQTTLTTSKRTALDQAASKLRSAFGKTGGNPEALSDHAIEDWLIRDELSAIAEQLKVPKEELKSFSRALDSCQAGLRKVKGLANAAPFEQLRAFHAAYQEKPQDEAMAYLLKKAKDSKLPSDVFLLPGFPTHVNRPALIMLREMIGVPADAVTTRRSEVNPERPFLRVGRLRSTFKFALSQSFGTLYSKIGLPAAYELRAKNAISGTVSYEWK